MATVQAIVSRKGSRVLSIDPATSVLDASIKMNDHKIGALVVLEAGRVVGIITERDVMQRLVVQQRNPASTRVDQVMTSELVTCHPEDSIDHARGVLMERRIRHLPVIDDQDRLVGLISIGDLNAWELTGQEVKIQALEQYLYGMV